MQTCVLGRDLQTVRPRPKGGDADHPPHSTFVDALEKSLETEVPACPVRRSHGRDISLIRRAWLDIAASSSRKKKQRASASDLTIHSARLVSSLNEGWSSRHENTHRHNINEEAEGLNL